jgi:hypothetical protein
MRIFLFICFAFNLFARGEMGCKKCSKFQREELLLVGPVDVKKNECSGHLVNLSLTFNALGKKSTIYSTVTSEKKRSEAYHFFLNYGLHPHLNIPFQSRSQESKTYPYLKARAISKAKWIHIDCSDKDHIQRIATYLTQAKKSFVQSSIRLEKEKLELFSSLLEDVKISFIESKSPWTRHTIDQTIDKYHLEESCLVFLDPKSMWVYDKGKTYWHLMKQSPKHFDYIISGILYGKIKGKTTSNSFVLGTILGDAIYELKAHKIDSRLWQQVKQQIYFEESTVHKMNEISSPQEILF